ncbi:hypothetical protein BYI23_E001290 (plasmid) [Burkholderia sp. YI23]|nr:hypothetical protein BYI23_E001290 [Burkholderia sp. YI23]
MVRSRMPRRKRVVSPGKNKLAHYKDRVVRVLGEARHERSMIEWVDEEGRTHKSAVKWANLRPLSGQLF